MTDSPHDTDFWVITFGTVVLGSLKDQRCM